jgi:ATP-dependent Lhr-like helicase
MNIDTLKLGKDWFSQRGWNVFPFQEETWKAYLAGKNGLVNAPTGSGKTYALMVPILLEFIQQHHDYQKKKNNGLRAIWLTPIRALAKEIELSANRLIEGLGLPWRVGIRSGDTSTKERAMQKKQPPEILITTPESLHLMLAQKKYAAMFNDLHVVVADEWHELMGSKRGVQVELALSRLKSIQPNLKIWGISATIGNLEEAFHVLLGNDYVAKEHVLIRADIEKRIEVISIIPDTVERMPWAGHLGIHLIQKVIEIVKHSNTTLIFTNTRSFAEIWYQRMLEHAPELSGLLAMHHGSISQELRAWVENQLHLGSLKAVVCTSSLDLGVDFRPVETVIQIGGPKGIAKFLQRAGRSGHQPGAISRIYFVPTHALELIEAVVMREALRKKMVEDRFPYVRSFDVLMQYLMTLAISDGFKEKEVYKEITNTFSYQSISEEEWAWLINFMVTGGEALQAYSDYQKIIYEEGIYKVENKAMALKHRLSIGTIVSDATMHVKFITGKYLGTIEEYFISSLNPGDVFWFAGRNLEFVRIKDMEVHVRKSSKKSGRVPSWQGGRMPLSSQMSVLIRDTLDRVTKGKIQEVELTFLKPIFDLQRERSILPNKHEFLIENFQTDEGHHVVMYPFDGRFVHEGMAALVAYRIAQIKPITFSIAMNDYGFELLSDQEIPIEEAVESDLLGIENLRHDIQASINSIEMARRRFRDIAAIAGLVFKGYPGRPVKDRHLQSSSQLLFDVFFEYENNNLLLQQAYEEVMDFQLEEARLRQSLERIAKQKIILKYPPKPTPFAFPIMVDRLREKLTSEKLEDRIRKMAMRYDS